jgi:hypothetical protein
VAVGTVFYRDVPALRSHILASMDGAVTWNTASLSPRVGDDDVYDVAYGNGVFLAFTAYTGASAAPTYEILTSSDGLNWRSATSFPTGGRNCVAFGNGQFVVGTDQGTAMTSPDGIIWRQHALPGVSSFYRVVFANGLFLAWVSTTGAESGGLWYSVDGFTWAKCGGVAAGFTVPLAGDGVFLATGSDGILYQSGPFERLVDPQRLPNRRLEWTVNGTPNINYRIEYSEDLRDWQTLEEVTNAPASRPFVDPGAATHTKRFYRVVTQ